MFVVDADPRNPPQPPLRTQMLPTSRTLSSLPRLAPLPALPAPYSYSLPALHLQLTYSGPYSGSRVGLIVSLLQTLPLELLLGSGSAELHTFVQEVVVMAPLRHPNIVSVLGASLQPPDVFLLMELCPTSLEGWLHRGTGGCGGCLTPGGLPPSPRQILRVAVDVARGLQYLHERSPAIVHRGRVKGLGGARADEEGRRDGKRVRNIAAARLAWMGLRLQPVRGMSGGLPADGPSGAGGGYGSVAAQQ